ncbi:uncharacterized protein N7458_008269 [Penicillium daleae]|uniref:Phosphoglycerate mutase n=1 Tax=Penicillium daleae TaxID=63821 RepID=A0AAD6C3I8_9EURO|nr:uncharacterized protein N7458_008269 [Penicillium daleae]KAJ5444397.1 hypothetical protein N7458_008269 [Penicillium daleae]
MIRHGEKPGDRANNLSAQGEERTQRLRNAFRKESGFDISYIITEHPKKGLSYSFHLKGRPYETVQPLAHDLEDFGVKFNTDIKKDDAAGIARAVKAYRGEGDVLIC